MHSEVRVEVDGRDFRGDPSSATTELPDAGYLSIVFRRVRVGVGLFQSFIVMFDRE